MQDHYQTLSALATGYFMNSGSKFYAYAYPVESESDAAAELEKLKNEHLKARHFCTAIRLQPDGSFTRSSDDGEPSGSAGKPILGQLVKYNITQVFVVVVRYFGGTKLGIPGLIEAYKTSTENALQQAVLIEKILYGKVQLIIPFDVYPGLLNHLLQYGYKVIETEFNAAVTIHIALRKEHLQSALLTLLKNYAQLDYTTVDAYAEALRWRIEILHDELVL